MLISSIDQYNDEGADELPPSESRNPCLEYTPKRLIQSIKRASDILELFLKEKKTLGITEFSQRLLLSKNTVQGIVNTLVELNYLEREPQTKKYRLGPMLFRLGIVYAENIDFISSSKVWLERLCYKFHLPVSVGILSYDKVIILARIEPGAGFMTSSKTGSFAPVFNSSLGKILCAFMDHQALLEIVHSLKFESFTEKSITSPDVFLKEIERVKKDQVSFDNEEALQGISCIAGPIFNQNGEVLAAFSVTGEAEVIYKNKKNIVDEIKYTSAEISKIFGYKA